MTWYPNFDGRDMSESLDRHITGNWGDDDPLSADSDELDAHDDACAREEARLERAERDEG